MLKKILDRESVGTSLVVGTGFHVYSYLVNHEHFVSITEDIAESRVTQAILKLSVPYTLPYAVSKYTKYKCKKSSE